MAHALSEPPIFQWAGLDTTTGVFKAVQGIYWKFFFTGISGVMVFFVISGLCIHLPNSRSLRIPCLRSYLVRRLLRIIPPVLPVVLFYHYSGGMSVAKAITATILWSVVCEVIYYLLYPILLAVRLRQGSWWWLVAGSYIAGICVVLTDPASTSYWSYGPWLTWILGLPCWLLGAALAEIIGQPRQPVVTFGSIIAWRLGIWSLAALCVALKFRTSLGDPWTMNLFALAAFFWIHREIVHFKTAAAWRIFEWMGGWSFSLYITHQLFWKHWQRWCGIEKPFGIAEYIGTIIAILAAGYIYYLAIERPTHRLSRTVARKLEPRG